MKNLILSFLFISTSIFGPLSLNAQKKIKFEYDASGNRTERSVIILENKSATLPQPDKQEEAIHQLLGEQEIRVYPNPTRGLLKIDFPALADPEVMVKVFSPQGAMLISRKAMITGIELDLSPYPAGFYLLVIQSGAKKGEWKIIKE